MNALKKNDNSEKLFGGKNINKNIIPFIIFNV